MSNKREILLDFRIIVKEVNKILSYGVAWTSKVPKKTALNLIHRAVREFTKAKYDEVTNDNLKGGIL